MNDNLTAAQKAFIEWINYVAETDDDVIRVANNFPVQSGRKYLIESQEFNRALNVIRRKRKIKLIQEKLIK